MPVSGNEETGVKPLSRQFSDYSADVPIKKRKIPTFWPPSSPPKEQPSHKSKDVLLEKCQSDHSEGPASMTFNISGSTDLSTPNNNMMCEEGKNSVVANVYVQHINTDQTKVKVEERNLSVNSGSLSDLTNKDNHLGTEGSPGIQEMMGKSELGSQFAEFNALSLGKDIYNRPTGDEKCNSEASGLSGITELSLGFKECLVSNCVGNNIKGQCPSKENTDEPISLDLSLSKGRCGSGVVPNTDGAHLRSNRSNWDLNTTMDVWEDSVNLDEKIGDAMDTAGYAQVTRTSICSTESVDAGFHLANQGVEENKQGIRFQKSALSAQLRPSASALPVGFRPSTLQSHLHQESMSSSSKNDSANVNSNISLRRAVVQPGSGDAGSHSIVKRELVEECVRQEFKVPEATVSKSLDCRKIKHDSNLESGHEAESSKSQMKLVVPKSVKSEPINEGNHDSIEAIKEMSVEVEKQIQGACNVIGQNSFLCEIPTHEAVSTASADVSNSSPYTKEDQNRMDLCQKTCDTPLQVGPEPVISSSLNEYDRSNVNVTRHAEKGDEKPIPDAENIRLEFVSEPCLESGVNCEASVSDEEKINISGDTLEEDSYGSDYESDGNHDVATAVNGEKDGEEDDFEDGEVRESVHCSAADETICEKKEVKHGVRGNSDDQRKDLTDSSGNDFSMVALPDGDETRGNQITKSTTIVHEEKKGTKNDVCLQGSPTIEMSKVADDNNIEVDTQIKSLDQSGREDSAKAKEAGVSSDEVSNGNQEVVNAMRSKDEIVTSELVKKNDLELTKGEASVSSEDATKDAVHGGNRSRIIKLPTSITSSPGKTRCASGRSVQSPGRERLPAPLFEAYRLHPRGRVESYVKRERHLNETSRSPRLNFINGRGRISSRITSVRGDLESECSLGPDYYDVQSDFRFPGQKYAPAVIDAEVNRNFEIVSDSSFVRGGWGGRGVRSDEAPNLRHLPLRRQSPDRRFTGHGFPMVRVPRNNSPSRCIGDDGSELLGMRHSQKFMRDCHDDNVDPMLTSAQPPFEGVGDHFVRGNRNFSSFRRKGLPRIRPNSPIRSRSRSPRPWSSPTRRSPDGFGGRSELPRRGSPMYRVERIRTCDHPFPREMVNRRHGSPLYVTRSSNMREDHGYPRSVMHNRSSPNRIIPKDKRFDVVDYRERTDRRDYFCGPVHASRFQELADEGNGVERRLTERQGPVRSFRPKYRRRYHD